MSTHNSEHNQFRGIYGITATPFHADDTLDLRSLESVVHFSVESGCHLSELDTLLTSIDDLLTWKVA